MVLGNWTLDVPQRPVLVVLYGETEVVIADSVRLTTLAITTTGERERERAINSNRSRSRWESRDPRLLVTRNYG